MMLDSHILELNKKGFIPAPNETEESFLKRVAGAVGFNVSVTLPFNNDNAIPSGHKKEALNIVEDLFDISPTWVPAFYHNYALAPWHAANSWIISEKEQPPVSLIQLKRKFKEKTTFLKIYHREEVIAHELVHAGHTAFEKSKYEEIFAYQTAKSPLRRYLGPIISSVIEAWIFIITMAIVLIIDMIFLIIPTISWIPIISGLQLLPWAVLITLLGRLIWRQYQYKKCVAKLYQISKIKKKARAITFRLTDKEIALFSKKSIQYILEYIEKNKKNSLRWQFIYLSYFQS